MSKNGQYPGNSSRTPLHTRSRTSRNSTWESRKPEGFDRVLEALTERKTGKDDPLRVLAEIEPKDAERREVKNLCSQLAFAALRECRANGVGDFLDYKAKEKGAFQELKLMETSAALQGGNNLVTLLQQGPDRDIVGWKHDLISQHMAKVSGRIDVPINVTRV